MRAIVCGGRHFNDWTGLCDALGHFVEEEGAIDLVLHGGATGADYLAVIWAEQRKIRHVTYPASWVKHGKAAGPIRNQQMLDEGKPNVVIAFPGGRGTADMVRRAKVAGVRVVEVWP